MKTSWVELALVLGSPFGSVSRGHTWLSLAASHRTLNGAHVKAGIDGTEVWETGETSSTWISQLVSS